MDETLETALKDLLEEMGARALRRPRAGWGRKALASLLSALLLLTGWPIAVPVHAAVPQFLNYQGKLGDAAGNPLTGTYSFRFKFFSTETGGSAIFSEDVTSTNALSVANGIYSVQIGSVTAGGIPPFVFDSTPVYLEVDVNTGASLSGAETLGPRERIVGSPFSWHSLTTEKLGTGVAIATFTAAGQLSLPGNLTASSGTFTLGGANQFSLNTSSGITVGAGVYANFFIGNGAALTGIVATTVGSPLAVDVLSAKPVTTNGGISISSHVFISGASVRLGVGTTTPATTLDVQGGVIQVGAGGSNVQLSANATGGLVQPSGTGLSLVYNALTGGRHEFDVNGSERMRLDSTGLLGVGTSSPLAELHVSSANVLSTGTPLLVSSGTAAGQQLLALKGDGSLQLSQAGTAGAPAINWALNGTADGDTGIYRPAADSLGFATAGNLRMTIANTAATLASGIALNLSGTGGFIAAQSSITTTGAFFGDGSHLTGVTATPPAEIAVSTIDATATTPYGGIVITSHVFLNNGNLGIGTTAPGLGIQLDATGTARFGGATGTQISGADLFTASTNSFLRLRGSSAGTTQSALLLYGHLAAPGASHFEMLGGTPSSDVAVGNANIAGANAFAGAAVNTGGGDVRVYGGNASAGGIQGDVILAHNGTIGIGSVGVGTPTPTALLHVSSANAVATSTPLLVSSGTAAGQQLLAVKGDGRIQFSQSGTAASPALNWALNGSPDGDMGIYRTAADSLGFATAATLRLTIANAGVTLAAGTPLSLSGAAGTIITQSSITTSGAFFGDGSHLTGVTATSVLASNVIPGTFANGAYTFSTNVASPALDINGSGAWSAGWLNTLRLTGTNFPNLRFFATGANKTSMIGNDNDGGLWFGVNGTGDTFGTYGMVLTPGQRLGVGATTTPSATVHALGPASTQDFAVLGDNSATTSGSAVLAGVAGIGGGSGYGVYGTGGAAGIYGKGVSGSVGVFGETDGGASSYFGVLGQTLVGVTGGGGVLGFGYPIGVNGEATGVRGETFRDAGKTGTHVGVRAAAHDGSGVATSEDYDFYAEITNGKSYFAGAVGVGITNPAAKVDIKGTGATSATASLKAANSAGTVGLFVRDDGNVGIGTTSPSSTLHVTTPGNTLNFTTSGAGDLIFNTVSGVGSRSVFNNNAGGVIALSVNSGEKLRVGLDSRVGIGTTTPVARLHVSSTSALAADTLLLVSSGTVAGQEVMAVKGDGKLGLGTTSPSTNVHVRGANAVVETIQTDVTSGKAGVAFQTTGGSTDVLEVEKEGSTASGTQAGVSLANMSRVIAGASAAHMMLGTVTNNHLHIITNNTERVRVLGTGEVAIGSTSPQGQLHVESVAYTTVTLRSPLNQVSTLQLLEGASPDFGAQLRYDGLTDRFHILIGAPPSIPFTPRLTILRSNGEVGLGTTNPAGSRLWVQGAATEGYHVRVSSQDATGSLFVVDRLGNVGIGLSNPSHVLELRNPGSASVVTNFEGTIQSYTNTGAFNHNAIAAIANDTGDSTGTTIYAQAFIAGIGSNPTTGNYGVWGHQPGTGAGGAGVVGSYGSNISSPDTWAALGGANWAGFFSGKVEVTGSVQIGSSGATCNSSVDGSTRYEPGAGGLSSRMMVCMKGSDQNFYWKTLNTGGPFQVYSADFILNGTPMEQCGQWNEFLGSVSGTQYASVTIRGSRNTGGRTCNGGSAQTICAALHNGTAVGPIACGGFNWYVGNCGGQEITADTATVGVCGCSATAWTVRPCLRNANWGAVADTTTCGATSQTLEVICSP